MESVAIGLPSRSLHFLANDTFSHTQPPQTMNRVFEIVAVLFCFELAVFLIIVPWSSLWESNILFLYAPGVRSLMLHTLARSGVTVLGFLDFLIGVSEVRRLLHPRPR